MDYRDGFRLYDLMHNILVDIVLAFGEALEGASSMEIHSLSTVFKLSDIAK